MKKLNLKDILILGLMNLALFVGAGNIIFPPYVGLMAGEHVWIAALGFLITAVGLPVIATIAMARIGGELTEITAPLGAVVGTILMVICYLCVGPLAAIPRAATVSFDLAIKPFFNSDSCLFIYSLIFFIVVGLVSLNPEKLFKTVGQFLSPIKVVALLVLCLTVLILPAGEPAAPRGGYATTPFSAGIYNGYLTIDTLGALLFSIVIIGAIRSRGVTAAKLITRYTTYAGIIAGIALIFVYMSLFRLGTASVDVAQDAQNGVDVLNAYVGSNYGMAGSLFLSGLIMVACLVTAIGLLSSNCSYFSALTGLKYKTLIWILSALSMVISNLGLTHLIAVSVPILIAISPVFVVLIALCFIKEHILSPKLVAIPACIIAFVLGVGEALKDILPLSIRTFYQQIPLNNQGLSWLLPCTGLVIIFWTMDRLFNASRLKKSS